MALPSKILVLTGISAGNTAHLEIHIVAKLYGWSTSTSMGHRQTEWDRSLKELTSKDKVNDRSK